MNATIAELNHVPFTRCIRVFRSRVARTSVLTTHDLSENSLTAQKAGRWHYQQRFSRSITKIHKELCDVALS